jgi:GR25 family glycosyltransferase involved in LPS biosynthesis
MNAPPLSDHPIIPPTYILHLDSAKEREPLIEAQAAALGVSPVIIQAVTGGDWWKDPLAPKEHPHSGSKLTPGMVGCTFSHLRVIREAIHSQKDVVLVLEDDAVFQCTQRDVVELIQHATKVTDNTWDILLLGANEYVSSMRVDRRLSRVHRFWGTHAMIVRRSAMRAVVETFEDGLQRGIFYPADWLYNEAIRRRGLVVLGPEAPRDLCRQAPGLVSAITGLRRPE